MDQKFDRCAGHSCNIDAEVYLGFDGGGFDRSNTLGHVLASSLHHDAGCASEGWCRLSRHIPDLMLWA